MRLFLRTYPWLHASLEGLRFSYQLLYLLENTVYYSPVLHLLGQRVVRVTAHEMVTIDLSAADDPVPVAFAQTA